MSVSNMKKITRQPLNVVVYENIKSAIVTGEIEAGTRLTETAISKQLSVSSTPVREAFRRLASEGLVKIIPWRGVIVQEFTPQEILEVYQCRKALEVLAIELAVTNIDEVGIQRLKELLKESKESAGHTKYVEINTAIHNIIFEYSMNNQLLNMIGQINDIVLHNRNFSSYSDTRKNEIYEEHKEMIIALEYNDKEKAAKAMEKHIESGYQYIKERFIKET